MVSPLDRPFDWHISFFSMEKRVIIVNGLFKRIEHYNKLTTPFILPQRFSLHQMRWRPNLLGKVQLAFVFNA
jgi:hypothetical protein